MFGCAWRDHPLVFITMMEQYFDLGRSLAGKAIGETTEPWNILPRIRELILQLQRTLGRSEYDEVSENIFIHKTAVVAPTSYLGAPCIVGAGTQIRHCAFVRGSALIGEGCVVGNSVELKNCILFDGVQVPHFNYVGDSVLGYRAHLGAGAITSNVKSDRTQVTVKTAEGRMPTGLKKFGAILGDFAEIGCNCVLNPGTMVGPRTTVYPLLSLRGVYPADSIVKAADVIVPRR